MDVNNFDVVIIGGGPTGSICGICLKKLNSNLRVCVVDKEKFPRLKACGDGLGPGVNKIITDLGLNSIFKNHESIEKLKITSPNGFQLVSNLPKIGDIQPVGYVFPRKEFDSQLISIARNYGVIIFEEWEYSSYNDMGNFNTNVKIKKNSDEIFLNTKILIGADGAKSKLRSQLNIPFNSKEHTGVALRYYCKVENYNAKDLRLDFLKEIYPGYGWVFPINKNLVNIGVGVDMHKIERKKINLNKMFESYINYLNTKIIVNKIEETKLSSILPYGSQLAPLVNFNNKILIGDSASMINPFSGEGIFYGMTAASILANNIYNKFENDEILKNALQDFESQFRNRFCKHYKINHYLKYLMGTRFSNLAIKASNYNTEILKEGIELVMGERRGLSLIKIIRIIFKGLFK